VVSDRWLPVSPNGRLDGYAWRVPLAEIGVSRPVIEVVPPAPPPPKEEAAAPVEIVAPEPVVVELKPEPAPAPVAPEPVAKPAAPPLRPAAKAKPVEPVIPLVHAPDDPGPDAGLDVGPTPETASPPSGDAWHRIRQLFR
jgi:HemY protein